MDKSIRSILEKLIDTNIVDVEKEYGKLGNKLIREIKTYEYIIDSLILIVKESPEEFIGNFNNKSQRDIYRVFIQDRKLKKESDVRSYLRHASAFEYNKGVILLRFSKPISIMVRYFKSSNADLVYDTPEEYIKNNNPLAAKDIVSVNNSNYENVVKELFSKASKIKPIVDWDKGKVPLIKLPSKVQIFIENFIERGGWEYNPSRKQVEIVKEWYQHSEFFKKIPFKVYRGLQLNSRWSLNNEYQEFFKSIGIEDYTDLEYNNKYVYIHPKDYPINCSTSKKVAYEYSFSKRVPDEGINIVLILEFNIKPDDVVIDMRYVEGPHPAQTEIVLDNRNKYEVRVVKVKVWKEGEEIKSR